MSAYLWHFAVIAIINRVSARYDLNLFGLASDKDSILMFFLFTIVVTIITAALSVATYQFVEQKFIRIGSRVARHYGRERGATDSR